MTIAISLDSVCKNFGDFIAIKDVSFDIADNEFFTLLGLSGCGRDIGDVLPFCREITELEKPI